MTQTLTSSQVVESMIEFVRSNLELQDKREDESKQTITFTGRGIAESDLDVPFALEVIVSVLHSDKALPTSFFKDRVSKRSEARLRKNRTYTGIIFPKSTDYNSAKIRFEGPYCKQAYLLGTARFNPKLLKEYERFRHYDVKKLARIEWEFAIPLGGSRIAYFNPAKGMMQIHDFQKFAVDEIIPDDTPIDKGYFWDYARRGYFPARGSLSRKANVFKGMQEGLHDKIRHIIRTQDIGGPFTLTSYEKGGARLMPYTIPCNQNQ